MKRTSETGLTLVELLVGMALLGIILTALTSFFVQTSRTSVQSSARAELQQETLNAQQLITGKVKEALYIYPTGSLITLASTNAPTVRNPVTNNQNWTVGTHPILAMILPPKNRLLTCATTVTPTQGPDGCYRFLAYYPVKRSVWVAGTAGDSTQNPGADEANDDTTWILAEYRATMPSAFTPTAYPTTPPTIPTGNPGRLLADYVGPTITTSGSTPTSNYAMFSYTPMTAGAMIKKVTFNLVAVRQSAGKTIRLPGASGTYTISIIPTNLGKIAAN